MNVECIGFRACLPKLTSILYLEDRKIYELCLIIHRFNELEKGFFAYKIFKPNKKGTEIDFRKVKDKDDFKEKAEELSNYIEQVLKDFNMKGIDNLCTGI